MERGNEVKRYTEWMNDEKRRKNEMKGKGKREGRRKGAALGEGGDQTSLSLFEHTLQTKRLSISVTAPPAPLRRLFTHTAWSIT